MSLSDIFAWDIDSNGLEHPDPNAETQHREWDSTSWEFFSGNLKTFFHRVFEIARNCKTAPSETCEERRPEGETQAQTGARGGGSS